MPKLKGTQNKINYKKPSICEMSIEDRIQLLANLILDQLQSRNKEADK